MKQIKLILILLVLFFNTFAQNKEFTDKKNFSINGYVENSKSSERLIGCVVMDSSGRRGITTNAFGYFNLTLAEGFHSVSFIYLGYTNKSIVFFLQKDTSVVIKLTEAPIELNEVKVINSRSEEILSRPQSGLINISNKDVKKLPSLLGEPDVMRAVQILPGIQAANERSTGISVRGGSIDQNLFLLDDAPIFQISHVSGFYSVFNNDAIKDIKIYKGDIPANYGGRLSSFVDIRLKDGNMQKYSVTGGLGLITSDLSIEGPILKDRVSFIVSGKYAYIGSLIKLINPNIDVSFYDLNCKLNAVINDKNRIFISSYNGGDNYIGCSYRNNTLSLRYNHIYNPKLFSNISLIYSKYSFISGNSDDSYSYAWRSGIKEITLKAEYSYYLNPNNTIDFGISATYNDFIPGKLEGNQKVLDYYNTITPFSYRVVNEQGAMDYAIYISNQQKVTDKLSFRYGLRTILYQDLGGHWVYALTNYHVTDSFYVAKNKTYADYFGIEPRLGINYRITQNSAIKASYTYTSQQTQLLTRSSGGGPLDIWFPSDNTIKPQTASQYDLGYVHYFLNNILETSIEGYYKKMKNILDYKDGATFLEKSSILNINKTVYNFEEQLRTGTGYSYGAELLITSYYKWINGSLSYTYARSKRRIPDINNGETYLSPFDRPHTLDALLNFNISKRITISSNYRRQSGQVTTIPIYTATMFGKTFKGYLNRNDYRLPYYERLDLSLTLKNKERRRKRYHGEWNFSVVNVTNHPNIEYVNFVPSKDNPDIIEAKGIYVLGFIPSISYRFNF